MRKIIFTSFLLVLCLHNINAQEFKVNSSDFIKDIFINKKNAENIKMVWWMPTCYWKISNQGNSFVTDKMIEELEATVDDYNIIAAIDGDIGPFGIKYKNNISLTLVDQNGNKYVNIPKEEISPEALSLLQVLKPVLSKMIGEMGENLKFYVFPLFKDGSKIDPYEEGRFTVLLNDEVFKYRLPLGSLLNKKKCPIDEEFYNGAWKYCPFHGNELVLK